MLSYFIYIVSKFCELLFFCRNVIKERSRAGFYFTIVQLIIICAGVLLIIKETVKMVEDDNNCKRKLIENDEIEGK